MKGIGGDLNYYYGVERGGNVREDPHGEFPTKNVLIASRTLEETAKKFDLTADEVRATLAGARKKLFEIRAQASPPSSRRQDADGVERSHDLGVRPLVSGSGRPERLRKAHAIKRKEWRQAKQSRRILTFILTLACADLGRALICLISLENYGIGAGEGNRTLARCVFCTSLLPLQC